jgi:hypothetical protein
VSLLTLAVLILLSGEKRWPCGVPPQLSTLPEAEDSVSII